MFNYKKFTQKITHCKTSESLSSEYKYNLLEKKTTLNAANIFIIC